MGRRSVRPEGCDQAATTGKAQKTVTGSKIPIIIYDGVAWANDCVPRALVAMMGRLPTRPRVDLGTGSDSVGHGGHDGGSSLGSRPGCEIM